MHPYLVFSLALVSGLGLVLYHMAHLVRRQMDAHGLIRRLVIPLGLLVCAVFLVGEYFWQTTSDIAVEVPIAVTGTGEINQEFWLTLAPAVYWSALVFYEDATSVADTERKMAEFTFEYQILINGEVVEQGLKQISGGPESKAFYDNIVVRSCRDQIRVRLRIKPGRDDQELPRMGYVLQTLNEFKYFSRGIRVSD